MALSRDELIAFFQRNDPNGVYSDAASDAEGYPRMTLASAREYLREDQKRTEPGDMTIVEWIMEQLRGTDSSRLPNQRPGVRRNPEPNMSHNAKPFRVGERVQLHAATDQWMQGDRYGTVVGYGRPAQYYDTTTKERGMVRPVRVRLDKSNRTMRFHPDNLFSLGEYDSDVSEEAPAPGRRPRVVRHETGSNPPSKATRRRFGFFKAHAGGVVGETAKSALALSRAEDWASAEGVTFAWEPETDVDDSWMTPAERAQPHEVYVAIARHPDGRIASLGNIFDPDSNYQRVVNAELALELMNE